MKELFKIQDLNFYEEDFLGDLEEYEDIIDIVRDLADKLEYKFGAFEDVNECCNNTKSNLLTQIDGFIDENDEFVTKEEADEYKDVLKNNKLESFTIRIYKCAECGKWDIDILE